MGNASNASVFISTLSEREDLIFGTLYLVFGKKRCLLYLSPSCGQPRCRPARDLQAFCSHWCFQKCSVVGRIIKLVLLTLALPALLKRMIWPKLDDCIPLSGELQVPIMFLNIWKWKNNLSGMCGNSYCSHPMWWGLSVSIASFMTIEGDLDLQLALAFSRRCW